MWCAGTVASQMDRLAAGKRLDRICTRSLARAAWSALVAYSMVNKLAFKLTRRISKIHCANAVHLLVRFQRLGSALDNHRDNIIMSAQRRVFSWFRRNCEVSNILVNRADAFHHLVIHRDLSTILIEWKRLASFGSRIQASSNNALRRWIFFAASKALSAWQSITLIACSNRDTAIKWRISCDRRRFLSCWADITREHKRIKSATSRIWMRNDSRSVVLFFAAWKSASEASITASKIFKSKWRLHLASAAFDRWCIAAGSLTALRLFVNGCNSNLRRSVFLGWRTTIQDGERKLHHAARSFINCFRQKCMRLWCDAATSKVKGRVILSNVFVDAWCSHLLKHFFSTLRSRVRNVKIGARISYFRCIVYQTAINAWKSFVFDDTQAVGSSSPVKSLRQSTAKRLWAYQFPPKSPSKSLRSSLSLFQQSRGPDTQVMDFDDIDKAMIQHSSNLLLSAFNSWLSVLGDIQAQRRVHTAAMQWHSTVYIRNLLSHVFGTFVAFAARSRTRLALKFKKCTQHHAARQKRTVIINWKQVSRALRHFRSKEFSIKTKVENAILFLAFKYWLHWFRHSRVRAGYLRLVVEPFINDGVSKRLLSHCRRALAAWRAFLIPRRISKRFARRHLLKEVGQMLVRWHHVAFCSVDDRVGDAIAGRHRHISSPHLNGCIFDVAFSTFLLQLF